MDDGRFSVSTIEGNGAVQSAGDKINGVALETSIINRPLRSSRCEDSVESGGIGETWLHDAGWRRKKSLAQLTREALPRLDNYRNSKRAIKRPSLGELHGELIEEEASVLERDTKSPTPGSTHEGIKLGWIQGVLIPCLLNIWGVMLFLRISWVVAQAGIGMSLVIIGISAAVCVITTLSLSAISTNGEVKGGGIYYIISRSLGAEFGASVGVVFAFANAVAASMNTIGFCDSLNDLLKSEGWSENGIDVRIVGSVALLVMCIICAVGMEWETKAQNFLIAIIVGAIVDFMVGTIIGPKTEQQLAEGFVGFNTTVLASNFGTDYRHSEGKDQDFFSVFAIFFPSVTGIQAGANISGDLKDPASSIPKGTLLALLISMVSYALMVLFAGGAALRDATGLNATINGTLNEILNETLNGTPGNGTVFNYGLHNSYTVMQLMSSWGPFIFAGCFAATLSTALTNLLSVPRLVQALGQDRIYPGLIFFSKGYGKNGEPYRGYVITFLVALLFLLIADLNTIAPLISNFYLASYALINFCTFHAAFVKPLGWRPTFRFYNAWLSLAGFVICVAIMFLISWVMSLVTFVIIFALYLIVMYRNPDVNWGSSTQAQTYMNALSSAHRLCNTGEHVKNYRPQLLVLCGAAAARPALLDLGHALTKGGSLMIAANISSTKLSYRARQARNREATAWLGVRKLRAFVASVDGLGFEMGARALVQASGIGKLAPNVLLMGYKGDWRSCPRHDLNSYFDVLHTAFENRLAVSILRVSGGLDYSRVTGGGAAGAEEAAGGGALTLTATSSSCELSLVRNVTRMLHYDSDLDIAKHHSDTNYSTGNTTPTKAATITEGMKPSKKDKKDKKGLSRKIIYQGSNGLELSKEMLTSMSIFQRKQPKGTLDVWWLYDDGGLTILLPYILSTRSQWSDCKLRIFALANRKYEMELEERNMANLLSKFRIDYSSLTMVQDITEPPQTASIDMFNGLIEGFREQDGATNDCCITEIELQTLQEKTYRQLRLRELLIQNSTQANLIIMSLPMPRKGSVPAPLYMAWLEMMSRDLPPVLFVRGNQTSVLTFYS